MNEIQEKIVKSYLPMSEQSFLLLLSLIEPRHGYGIMQTVTERSNGRINLGASTVYTILYKMEQDSLITVISEQDRRKVYEITEIGLSVLSAETHRITQLSKYANSLMNSSNTKIETKA